MKTNRQFIVLLVGSMLTVFMLQAQQQYSVDTTSSLTVDGTSTLHSFTLKSKSITGAVVLAAKGPSATLDKISITVPVKALHSGEDGMDKNMYESMNADSHPSILFESSSAENVAFNDSGKADLRVPGMLTINGVSRKIEMNVTAHLRKGNTYAFEGSQKLLMSDFGIDPPSMFFGTIKTGDEVTVHFTVLVETTVSGQQAGL